MENFIVKRTNLSLSGVKASLKLFDEDCTIPFIARYRKEVTGNLDEVELEKIMKYRELFHSLVKRKEAIIKAINEQGQLTDSLKKQINEAESLNALEDLYAPYKRRKKTKADLAREAGYEQSAIDIFQQKDGIVLSEKESEGVVHIIAEWISHDQIIKNDLRQCFQQESVIKAIVNKKKIKEPEAQKYKDYFDYEGSIHNQPAHRILALFRGESEGYLKLKLSPEDELAFQIIKKNLNKREKHPSWALIETSYQDGYKRLLQPSLEKEYLNILKERADLESITIFRKNLENLLLSSPFGNKAIIGIDPGFRTGCKVVLLSDNGDLLANRTIYPLEPHNKQIEAQNILEDLMKRAKISAIAFGNGTGGRELEKFLKDLNLSVPCVMVNESGASIYSASEEARREFPDYDITVRGAVSIGRRFQDPLAELVKIEPKSLGVGQYQHDVNQKDLSQALDFVVDSCVNRVGIDINTASESLLKHIAGLNNKTANNIVHYRRDKGSFTSKEGIKKVSGIGPKAFEQAAGFLRIPESLNILDKTGVHPEQYEQINKALNTLNITLDDIRQNELIQGKLMNILSDTIGKYTAQDIVEELIKPGRDPRAEFEIISFADGINTIEDLEKGMSLTGIITNVTAFGAFVDIGVHQDGLVHISQLSNSYVNDPTEIVKVGDKVEVKILTVEVERHRISLSMKG
ncbi:helix-hairpin-helix domain-containing protein [Spirochaeta cellobiosiphila]|uniref:helix-hairpin-helix domain-containing protein n=1 Tax=Spirochaeta cellobiosiphila TaxID=504483 RepID=UPI0003FAF1C5|nr:Tex family protein [Spirochaeta cellobiosiphila]